MNRIRFFFSVAVCMALTQACSEPQATDEATEERWLAGFRGLVVLTTDYVSVGRIHFRKNGQSLEIPVHPDTHLRLDDRSSRLYVVQRMGADSFFWIDLMSGKRSREVSVLRGSNLQDLYPTENGTAWVTAYNSSVVTEVDLTTGSVVRQVGLDSRDIDVDGASEAKYLFHHGDTWGTVFQRLDNFAVVNDARLLTWQQNGSNVAVSSMGGRNPVTSFKPHGNSVFIGSAGIVGVRDADETHAGIERLSQTLAPQNQVISEQELGGDIVDFEMISGKRGIALVSAPQSRLVAFDPSIGKRLPNLAALTGPQYTWVDTYWEPATQRLYLADRDPQRPRVRVLDENLIERTEETVALSLPPSQILVH